MGFIFICKCPAKQPIKFRLFRTSKFLFSIPLLCFHCTHTQNQSSRSPSPPAQRLPRLELEPPNAAGTAAVTGQGQGSAAEPFHVPNLFLKQGLTKHWQLQLLSLHPPLPHRHSPVHLPGQHWEQHQARPGNSAAPRLQTPSCSLARLKSCAKEDFSTSMVFYTHSIPPQLGQPGTVHFNFFLSQPTQDFKR